MNIIIYYINLKHRIDRKDRLLNELNNINIPIERIDAIDKKNLNKDDLIKNKYISDNTTLRLGQIACILSHKKAWEYFLNSNYDYAIFLEDDVVINKKYFELYFDKILNELNNIDFDWLYLGRNNLQFKNFYKGKNINKYFYQPDHLGVGCHSYLLSKNGARIKINYYNKLKGNIYLTNHPLDLMESNKHLIKHYLNKDIKILSILPDKYYNNDIIIESFSNEFLFYPINISDSDTS
jgi:GR25 family glycosyltransferase involved in LPS biosynthesis